MSDTEYTAPNNELRAVYNAAIDTAGREAANQVCIQHGATAELHPWRRVSASKAKACFAALTKLAGDNGGRQRTAAAPTQTRMEQIRRQSFANLGVVEERKPAPAAKRLDPESIYSKWNAAKRSDDD